jgi:hypothetical protein
VLKTNCAAQKPLAENIQRDARADEGTRLVRLTRGQIRISRRLAGISMTIVVPVATYHGVALGVETTCAGGAAYRLALTHRDSDLDVVLAETNNADDAAADWKFWASVLALPRLYTANGKMEPVDRAQRKAPFKRPRNASVAKRRPRFLTRRKRGVLSRKNTVFAGEREIICYE